MSIVCIHCIPELDRGYDVLTYIYLFFHYLFVTDVGFALHISYLRILFVIETYLSQKQPYGL
jgi:hypothetical protein